MADISQDDVRDLIEAMRDYVRVRGGTSKGSNSPSTANLDKDEEKSRKKYIDGLNNATKALTDQDKGLKQAHKTTQDVTKQMGEFKKKAEESGKALAAMSIAAGAVGTIVGALSSTISESIDTYRQMANVGQTFSGSMMEMHIAAAEARLPLEEFAKAVSVNSKAISTIGTKAFSDLGLGLRSSLREFGMLGLTTENLTEYLGDYLETQRLYGGLQNINQQQAVESMQQLAIETTKMSALTGVERKKIMERTQEALRENSMRSYMFMQSGKDMTAFSQSMQKVTTYFAGLPGEAGDTMSRMLSQTVGRGSSLLSDDMQTFVQAGMFGVTDMFDQMARKIKAGTASDEDIFNFQQQFLKQGKANMASLKLQADLGNESARKVVNMITEMENLDGKKKEEIKKQAETTQFFLNLQDTLKRVTGFIKEQFMKGFLAVWKGFDQAGSSGLFEKLTSSIGGFAERFGTWVAEFIQSGKLEEFGMMIGNAAAGIGNFVLMVADGVGKLKDLFNWFGEHPLTGLATAGALAGGLMGAKSIKNKMNERFELSHYAQGNALRVVVVGSGGSSVDLPNGRSTNPRSPAKPKSWFGRMAERAGNMIRKIPGASKIGGFLKGPRGLSVGALASMAGSWALSKAPNFTGKGLLQGGLGVAGTASTGAMLGSAFGPVGTAIGGIAGGLLGLYQNWDDISKGSAELYDKAVSGATSVIEGFMTSIGSIWNDVANYDWAGLLSGVESAFTAVQEWINGAFSKIGAFFGNMFSWLFDMFGSGAGFMKKAMSMTPIGAAVITAMDTISGASVSGPTSNKVDQAATVNVDALQQQVTSLKQQQEQIIKENADLKNQMNRLLGVLEENNLIHRSGYGELINETAKVNRNTGKMADGGI